MNITRTTTKTYEIKFFPDTGIFNKSNIGWFLSARKKMRMSTRQFEKCFICGHVFENEDKPCFITVSGKGNLFACQKCTEENRGENNETVI